MMKCNVCQTELDKPLYEALSDQSLTSLCELRQGKVKVWLCSSCGHLSGEALPDTKDFYETEYRIMLNQDDEDQIYEVRDKHIVYRTAHQLDILFAKLDLPKGSRILDYGCAKALMLSRLMSIRPDLQVYLFDVSSMYVSYWQKFLSADRWAINETPENWLGSFEVVTSFFTLEHIPDPIDTVRKVATLLNKDGVFYGIVPDTFGNVADFIVIDHVNHFTEHSLYFLLKSAGFNNIKIDTNAHRGALVFIARKTGDTSICLNLKSSLKASEQLAGYWTSMANRLKVAESDHNRLPAAIYGSGFYGAYIFSMLERPQNVRCFLDMNPFQQTKKFFGRVVLEPSKLSNDIRLLYIGLSPHVARDLVGKMDWLRDRDIKLIFLDKRLVC